MSEDSTDRGQKCPGTDMSAMEDKFGHDGGQICPQKEDRNVPQIDKLIDKVIENEIENGERTRKAPRLKRNGNTVQLDTKARPFDLAEVVDYFLEIDDTEEEAHQFWDYWESAGWRRKNGPIRDWKASARTWIRSPYRKPKKKELIDQIKENLNYYNNHFNR